MFWLNSCVVLLWKHVWMYWQRFHDREKHSTFTVLPSPPVNASWLINSDIHLRALSCTLIPLNSEVDGVHPGSFLPLSVQPLFPPLCGHLNKMKDELRVSEFKRRSNTFYSALSYSFFTGFCWSDNIIHSQPGKRTEPWRRSLSVFTGSVPGAAERKEVWHDSHIQPVCVFVCLFVCVSVGAHAR